MTDVTALPAVMSTMFMMFSDKQLNSAEVKIFLEFTPMAKIAHNR